MTAHQLARISAIMRTICWSHDAVYYQTISIARDENLLCEEISGERKKGMA